MKLGTAQQAASLVERLDDLEKIILQLELMRDGKSFKLSAVFIDPKHGAKSIDVEFKEGRLSTEIFQQNILDYTINNFNVELVELREELEKLV